MMFKQLELAGAYLISAARIEDDRGYFARTFCVQEFERNGLPGHYVQHSISSSKCAGTIRGLHYQIGPHSEAKVVRVSRGRIFDVIVDLRRESSTFGKWTSVELKADSSSLFIPEGFAHGLQTLEDDTEVHYLISKFYNAEASRSLNYADPTLSIPWPLEVTAISTKDKSAGSLKEIEC